MVGGAGFELATLCSQNRCATTALTPDSNHYLHNHKISASFVLIFFFKKELSFGTQIPCLKKLVRSCPV